MEPHIEYVRTALDARMRVTPKGFPYWYARDLMEILAYARWENFKQVIEKAIQACDNSGKFSSDHFLYMTEMIEAGTVTPTRSACTNSAE
jgi:DNA-damage-inducible protein D